MTKLTIQTQFNSHKLIRRSFPIRSRFPATMFDPSTQTWEYVSPTAPSDSSCLSPRLAAAAATPAFQVARSHPDSTEKVWKILTLTILLTMTSAALMCLILTVKSASSVMASKVETVKTVLHSTLNLVPR